MNRTELSEKAAYTLFTDALPYYWSTLKELPAGLRFRLSMNGYGSAAMACVDIANHWLSTPKLVKEAQKQLTHMQAWKGGEP